MSPKPLTMDSFQVGILIATFLGHLPENFYEILITLLGSRTMGIIRVVANLNSKASSHHWITLGLLGGCNQVFLLTARGARWRLENALILLTFIVPFLLLLCGTH